MPIFLRRPQHRTQQRLTLTAHDDGEAATIHPLLFYGPLDIFFDEHRV